MKIYDWATSTQNPDLLLLLGGPRTGKSTIATTIAGESGKNEKLSSYTVSSTPSPKSLSQHWKTKDIVRLE